MRILFLTRLFYPHIGGVEKHVFEVGKRLVKKGYKVTVLTEIPQGFSSKELDNLKSTEGMEIIRIPVPKNERLKKFAIWYWLLRHIDLINKADVVHCHDVFFWYLPFRFLFPLKKIYVTFHGYEGNKIPGKKAIFIHKLGNVLSNGNICVGDFFKKWYGTKPTYTTYGAVEVGKIRNPKSEIRTNIKYQISNIKKWKILFVGRLEKETGIMEYLKTLKILQNRGYKSSLLVLGDGSQRREAEKYCSSNKLNVEFKGFVQSERIFEYLKKMDFVFTSRYLGILESMAEKKYVFAIYNNSIKKDYLWNTPFAKYISISKNDSDLASEIIHVINNPKIAFEKTEKAFNWANKQTWERMLEVYQKLWCR